MIASTTKVRLLLAGLAAYLSGPILLLTTTTPAQAQNDAAEEEPVVRPLSALNAIEVTPAHPAPPFQGVTIVKHR